MHNVPPQRLRAWNVGQPFSKGGPGSNEEEGKAKDYGGGGTEGGKRGGCARGQSF